MNIVAKIPSNDPMTEKEQFWKEHAKRQRESGLSRVMYCRKHQLSYDQFGYWARKWRQEAAFSGLLPINVEKLFKTSESQQVQTLCTLTFKNGHKLKIHDKSVLPMLLSFWA